MDMKFRNYCIIVLGKTDGCKPEISKISETDPKFLESTGIVISTFSSVFNPKEMEDYFKSLNRNFMVFDTDQNSSGFNLTNKKLHDELFGELDDDSFNDLEEMTNRLIDEIKSSVNLPGVSGDTRPSVDLDIETITVKSKTRYKKDAIENMGKDELDDLFNKIIDKGIDNLTDEDKEILDIISKKK